MKKLFVMLLIFFVFGFSNAQEYQGFSWRQSLEFHKQFSPKKWGEGGELSRYVWLNMSEFWNHTIVSCSESATQLPLVVDDEIAKFVTKTNVGEMELQDFVVNSPIDGVLVLHKGNIVFESYPRMFPHDKHIHMSVSKVFVSTLVAILEERKQINVLEPIDNYLPELKGSSWEGIQIINILDMSSGINSFRIPRKGQPEPDGSYERVEVAVNTEESLFEVLSTLESHRPAGEVFEYANVNTMVLTILIEQVTNQKIADLIEKEIWQPMGAESDAIILNGAYGRAKMDLGISSTLRDLARFGLLFTPSGRQNEDFIIPNAYLQKIQNEGRPELFDSENHGGLNGESPRHNTYQWDKVMQDGDFYKGGFGGQGLYISTERDLVIAFFGTPGTDMIRNGMQHVARQLATSGLFENE